MLSFSTPVSTGTRFFASFWITTAARPMALRSGPPFLPAISGGNALSLRDSSASPLISSFMIEPRNDAVLRRIALRDRNELAVAGQQIRPPRLRADKDVRGATIRQRLVAHAAGD